MFIGIVYRWCLPRPYLNLMQGRSRVAAPLR